MNPTPTPAAHPPARPAQGSTTQQPKVLPKIRGRSCRNCTGPIPRPKGNNLKKKVFCSDNCRKEFHKNNGISVHRLKEQVDRWVTDKMEAYFAEQRSVLSEKFSRLPAAPVTRHALLELVNGK